MAKIGTNPAAVVETTAQALSQNIRRKKANTGNLPNTGNHEGMLAFPWEYCWAETNWLFDTEIGFYPRLRRQFYTAGLNGIDGNGNASDASDAFLMKRGLRPLELGDYRLGKYANYCVPHTVQGRNGKPKTVYLDMFTYPVVVGKYTEWKVNDTERKAFYKFLVSEGIIPPCHTLIKEQLIHRQQSRVERIANDLAFSPNKNPVLVSRLEKETKTLDAMQDAYSNGSN